MTKKLHSKLLSVILVIAICCAALCGSIIATNAAAADYKGTYTFSGGIAAYGAKQAMVDLKFDLDAGFAAGEFAVLNTADKAFADLSVKAKSGTLKDGSQFDASNIEVNFVPDSTGANLGYVTFWTQNLTYYTSLTFELTYIFAESKFVKSGTKYTIDVADFVFMTGYDPIEPTFTGDSAYIHTHHNWISDNMLQDLYTVPEEERVNGATYHSVFKEFDCLECDISYVQLYPDYTTDPWATELSANPDGNVGISGVNAIYNDDGTLNIVVHGYSPYFSSSNYIVVTDENGKLVSKITDSVASEYAGNILSAGAQKWTIENLSATNITKKLVITMLAHYSPDANTKRLIYSTSINFSIADYCEKVVSGDAVWPEGTLDSQIEADKDVAAALYYYGASIDPSVFDKHTGGSEEEPEQTITTLTDSWNGEYDEPKDIDNDGIIDITSAEEMAWVAIKSGNNSAGKSYKVIDGMRAFYMNPNTANLTIEQVENNLNGNNKYTWEYEYPNFFQGSFDGNGVTIYGLYSSGIDTSGNDDGGLFPKVKGAVTIENVAVKNSYTASYSYAGALIGFWDSGTTSVTIRNCESSNNYVAATRPSKDGSQNNAASAISGGSWVDPEKLLIDNCIVYDNRLYSASNCNNNAFVAHLYVSSTNAQNGNYKITNSIAIGAAPWAGNYAYWSRLSSIYSNLYTDTDTTNWSQPDWTTPSKGVVELLTLSEMQGTSAVSKMKLNDSVWYANDGLPTLKVLHDFKYVSNGDSGHTYKCVDVFDGTACSICEPEAIHVLQESDDGKTSICSACGYSKETVSKIEYVDKTTVKWTGDQPTSVSLSGSGDSADDPCIITTPGELWYVTQLANDDRYYKIADNIGVIDFQGKNWGLQNHSMYFKGHFDGNGVKLINFYSSTNMAALFPNVSGNAVIENINITGANITTGTGQYASNAGCIIANLQGTANVTIRNCMVTNSTVTARQGAGAIIGSAGSQTLTVDNCFVANNTIDSNIIDADTQEYKDNAVIGYGHTSTRTMNNTIAIGNDPSIRVDYANNVYTDVSTADKFGITIFTTGELTGANALSNMNLSDDIWFVTDSYPELKVFHKFANEYIDETTHKPICVIRVDGVACTVCLDPQEHTLTENAAGTANECSCGYSQELISKINRIDANYRVWTGNKTKPTTRNASGDYIINTPEELAWVALSGGEETKNTKYIVAPNSVFNMDGMQGITLNSTVDDIRNATKNSNRLWTSSATFYGDFDGNGLVVYNITNYAGSKTASAGLFPTVCTNDNDVTSNFENVTVKASYFIGWNGAAGIVGAATAQTTTQYINFNNCVVENCYMSDMNDTNPVCSRTSGTLAGHIAHNIPSVNNCFVKGNVLVSTVVKGGFIGNTSAFASGNIKVNNSISIGTLPYSTLQPTAGNDSNGNPNKVNTQVVNPAGFVNVYTDQSVDSSYTGIKTTVSTGANALSNMNLSDDIWFVTDSYPELKVFHDMTDFYLDDGTHQTVCQIFVDGVQCDVCGPVTKHTMINSEDGKTASCSCGYSYEVKGIHTLNIPEVIKNQILKNEVYKTKFSSNAAFADAYSADEITANGTVNDFCLYTTSLNLKTNPHIAITFAFNGIYKEQRAGIYAYFNVLENDGSSLGYYSTQVADSNGNLNPNWVNNAGAGRYHLYRFKDLPVKYLCKKISIFAETYAGDQPYIQGTFSAAGYAINAMNLGADYADQVSATMALVYYSEMLNARF